MTHSNCCPTCNTIWHVMWLRSGTYLYKLLIALDMLGAVVLFRDADVTISAMTGLQLRRARPAWWARILGGFLNGLSHGHCERAMVDDIARAERAINRLSARDCQQGR